MSEKFHEFALIEWIRSQVSHHSRVTYGIGDDTAVFEFPEPTSCLITTDMLMEGVHFHSTSATPREIGRKTLAVNLSDIAAMAGKPLLAVVSLALSRQQTKEFTQELHQGIQQLATEFQVSLVGGDTNVWDGPLVVNVTLLGEVTQQKAVLRSGAQLGDWIMVTGDLGGSLLGKHLNFQPRIHEALELHQHVELHSMIDVSDGLAADLFHLLDESQVGAELFADQIPLSKMAYEMQDQKTPLEHALSDGEDFELLFTISEAEGRRLLTHPLFKTKITQIGTIVESGTTELIESTGKRVPLSRVGWEHQF